MVAELEAVTLDQVRAAGAKMLAGAAGERDDRHAGGARGVSALVTPERALVAGERPGSSSRPAYFLS